MAQNYKIRNMLKDLPFYSEEIKTLKETTKEFLFIPPKYYHNPLHAKKLITSLITLKKYTYKSENTLMTPFHSNNF